MIKTPRMPASGNYADCRYFRIDGRALRWGSYVTTLGESRVVPGSAYPPVDHPAPYHFNWEQGRSLNECQIVYISEGFGTIETEDLSLPIRSGDALLLRPGVWHRYKPAAHTGWHEYWVGLGGETVERILGADLIRNNSPLVVVREERALLNGFHDLFQAAEHGGPAFQQELAARAIVLMSLIYSSTRPANPRAAGHLTIVEQARSLMIADETRDMSLDEMAKLLQVSYSKFRRLFRENTGVSIHQYRIHLKMSTARELLRSTDLRIKEISDRCGFQEEHYFCRLFKIHTGVSPSDFRMQCASPTKQKLHAGV